MEESDSSDLGPGLVLDPNLSLVIESWSLLSDAIRQAILTLVKSVTPDGKAKDR